MLAREQPFPLFERDDERLLDRVGRVFRAFRDAQRGAIRGRVVLAHQVLERCGRDRSHREDSAPAATGWSMFGPWMPPARGCEYASSSVFFTLPWRVTNRM